jgi:hypothetical protein
MKVKVLLLAGILFFVFSSLMAQHFNGLNKQETRTLARSNGFFPDDMVVSQSFNYLKFVNHAGTKTLIVFFSDEDLATYTKTICDYSEYDFVIADLNRDYKKTKDFHWTYKVNKETFEVVLEELDWYFVVRTKKK